MAHRGSSETTPAPGSTTPQDAASGATDAPAEIIPRAMLDAAARQLHPKGLLGLPAMLSMMLGLEEVPPALAALGEAIANPELPISITLSAGGAAYRIDIQ